jgi:hypothetical protein
LTAAAGFERNAQVPSGLTERPDMKILLWALGGVWFLSAVLFVLALAGAAARRISTSVKVATPESNRKRHLVRLKRIAGGPDSEKPIPVGKDGRPFLVAIFQR